MIALGRSGLFVIGFALFVDEQSPDSAKETINTLNSFGAPGLHHLEWTHEHFVKAERVRAKLPDDGIRIDDIAAGLAHLETARVHLDERIGLQHERIPA